MPPPPSRRTVLRSALSLGAGAALAGGPFGPALSPARAAAAGPGAVIPAPQEWTAGGTGFGYGAGSRLVVDSAYAGQLEADARTFAADLAALTGTPPQVVVGAANGARAGDLLLTLGSTDAQLGEEGYALTIAPTLRLRARTATGVFRGSRTVLQLLRAARTIAGGTLRDWPRYPERGLLVANEPKSFSTRWWQEQIRELAYLKMNMLSLYVGYKRVDLAQMKAVARFAARYHVTVVPQFNMPGHLETELTGRPELHLPGRPASLDLSRESGYTYAREQLAALLPEFEGPHWHLGADEYLIGSDYDSFPQLAAYARAHYGPEAKGVDAAYGFVNLCHAQVRAAGRTMRIWNDGMLPDPHVQIDREVLVEHWISHGRPAAELLRDGYRVQNSNLDFLYYDLGGRRPDPAKIYEGFRVGLFSGSSVPDDTPGLLGAKLHVWTVPDVETEVQIYERLHAPLRSLAQITWGSPKPAAAYPGFAPLVDAVGHAPGTSLWLTEETALGGRAFRSADGGEQHVLAAAGANGGLLHWYWSERAGRMTAEHWPGGQVAGAPAGFAHGTETVAFARGTDDALRHWSRLPGALPAEDDWGAGPGTVTSAPAAYAVGGQQHVYHRAADGSLAHRFRVRGGEVVAENWGGQLDGAPAAFVHGTEQHVFARTAADGLGHWWYPGPGGTVGRDDWGAAPGSVTSEVAALALGGQQHVFHRAADGTLAHRFRGGSGAVVAESWGGELAGAPVAFLHGQEVHVFARAADGTLRHWSYEPGTGLRREDWDTAGAVTDDPAGLAVGDQHHVWFRGASGSLAHRFYDHSAGRVTAEDWGGSIPVPA
ncbi:glycoside hydrolase family 20 zincin-like fold domain-containing protein [Streptomyces physcomitrii]|uniref:glycoside hydrolase family 20 zincin-like fold domain-containing protein n=1 Tax=Streptomyces physcomitrii TaxID=2724184 RepID=UPI0006984381